MQINELQGTIYIIQGNANNAACVTGSDVAAAHESVPIVAGKSTYADIVYLFTPMHSYGRQKSE